MAVLVDSGTNSQAIEREIMTLYSYESPEPDEEPKPEDRPSDLPAKLVD